MKCHYEVLEIERDATSDEIKKAYRRLALKWHPDKNPDNIDECTKQFALLQQANEVLSDSHERAWYDRHRDQILKGGFDEHYLDEALNVYPYFTQTCYKGFDDNNEKSFFSVYRKVFETIVMEDEPHFDDPTIAASIPSFGDSESNYDTVVGPFYAHWAAYNTAKSYSWKDKYDIRQAPNRPTMRAMEKENQKLRNDAKKQRNEEIRELVAFVRKRDPRVKAYRALLEEKRLESQQKQKDHRFKQLKMQQEQTQLYKPSAWETSHDDDLAQLEKQLRREYGDSTDEAESSDDDEEEKSETEVPDIDPLYCYCCEKAFKSDKALDNHKKSKKHKELYALLKEQIKEDDLQLFNIDKTEESEEEEQQQQRRKNKKKRNKKKQVSANEDEDIKSELCVSSETKEESLPPVQSPTRNIMELHLNDAMLNNQVNNSEVNSLHVHSSPCFSHPEADSKETYSNDFDLDTPATNCQTSVRKDSEQDDSGKPETPARQPLKMQMNVAFCDKCKEGFTSRTKLFAHIKATGHATLKTESTETRKKMKKNRKK